MHLVVGLGNPGTRYAGTRHSVGRMVVRRFAERVGIELGRSRFRSRFGEGQVKGARLALMMPQTYMNLSGAAVAPAVRYYRIEPGDVVIVHDDVDLPLGRIRAKVGGGAGGHKGVRSVIADLGSQEFARLRVGIGRPAPSGDVTGFVLAGFGPDERPVLEEVLDASVDALGLMLEDGVQRAMQEYNGWRAPSADPG